MKKEILITTDRSGNEFILGPTYEEAVTTLISGLPISYK